MAYLVMAHVDGERRFARLAASGRLSAPATMSIVSQTAEALRRRRRRRHRPPGREARQRTHRRPRSGHLGGLRDRRYGRHRGIRPGVRDVLGTARGRRRNKPRSKPYSGATDVYALGISAYECLAGVPPFPGNDVLAVAMAHVYDEPPPLPADVPATVRDVVMTALAKDPASRYPTGAAMAAAARRAADPSAAASPATAMRPSIAPTARFAPTEPVAATGIARPAVPSVPPKRRSKRGVAAAVASLAIVGIALAVLLAGVSPGYPGTTPPRQPTTTSSTGGPGPSGSPGQSGETPNAAIPRIVGRGAQRQAGGHDGHNEAIGAGSLDRAADDGNADRWQRSIRCSESIRLGRRRLWWRGYVGRRAWRRCGRRDSNATAQHHRMIGELRPRTLNRGAGRRNQPPGLPNWFRPWPVVWPAAVSAT